MSYSKCPSSTPILLSNKVIIKGYRVVKIMSQIIDGNKIKRRVRNIEDTSKG